MTITNPDLKKRIIEISHKHGLSHLGSCLTSVDIIDEIYQKMNLTRDKFVLSCGHAGLALYTVLEKYRNADAEQLFLKHGVHPNRDALIDCSSGSLGLGFTIAIGMALAERKTQVYVLLSDGELFEGTIWEGLNLIYKKNIHNIHIYVNMNGYSAYDTVNERYFNGILLYMKPDISFRGTDCKYFPALTGLSGHYKVLTQEEYDDCIKRLSANS